jgi:hypothetical protein
MRKYKLSIYFFCVILLVLVVLTLNHRRTADVLESAKNVEESNVPNSVESFESSDSEVKFDQEPVIESVQSSNDFFAQRMYKIIDSFVDAKESDQRKILASIELMFRDFHQQSGRSASLADYQECLATALDHQHVLSMLLFWAATNDFYESLDSKSKELYQNQLAEMGEHSSDSVSIVAIGALRRLVSKKAQHDLGSKMDVGLDGEIGVDEFRGVVSSSTIELTDEIFNLGVAKLNDQNFESSTKVSILAELNRLSGYGLLRVDHFSSGMLRVAGNENNSLEVKYHAVQMLVERNVNSMNGVAGELKLLIESSRDLEFRRLSKNLLAKASRE